MSLFKILRGDSSRISTDLTQFHDGWAYFTPDDGGFYIDAVSGNSNKRIRINTPVNDQTPTYTKASANAELVSGEKLSVAFGKIAKAISSLISHLANKSNPHGVTASQLGAVPTARKVNGKALSADITLVAADVGAAASGHTHDSFVSATLTASGWSSGKQTVSVAGITADTNGTVGLAHTSTTTQIEAAKEADLHVCGQANGSITVAALGNAPTVDIPISVIIIS